MSGANRPAAPDGPTLAAVDRHAHSVLAVCADLHAAFTGAGATLHSTERLRELTAWLRQRLLTWTPSTRPELLDVESAIEQLACRVCDNAAAYLRELDRRAAGEVAP